MQLKTKIEPCKVVRIPGRRHVESVGLVFLDVLAVMSKGGSVLLSAQDSRSCMQLPWQRSASLCGPPAKETLGQKTHQQIVEETYLVAEMRIGLNHITVLQLKGMVDDPDAGT